MHAHTSGFRAFSLSDILESADDIDQVFNRVARYGGRVSKPPTNAGWGYNLTSPIPAAICGRSRRQAPAARPQCVGNEQRARDHPAGGFDHHRRSAYEAGQGFVDASLRFALCTSRRTVRTERRHDADRHDTIGPAHRPFATVRCPAPSLRRRARGDPRDRSCIRAGAASHHVRQ